VGATYVSHVEILASVAPEIEASAHELVAALRPLKAVK
jgi:hypothetical protein